MPVYELNTLLSNLCYSTKQDWEQTRLIGYIIAQVNSSKKLKPSDIINFQWDIPSTENNITQEDISKFKELKKIINY